jgi:hypothetical protein
MSSIPGTSGSALSMHTPLAQVAPWKANETVLITDSVEYDGRFVLYTIAAAVSNCKILWLGNTTENLIRSSFKKMQGGDLSRVTVHSVPTLIEAKVQSGDFVEEAFVKDLYNIVRKWRQEHAGDAWVVFEDASMLATMVGDRSAYALVFSLRCLSKKATAPFGFAVRCSNDADMDDLRTTAKSANTDWFGAGGKRIAESNDTIPWERTLTELADTVVDVVPLVSGKTRDVHGRLIFTTTSATTVFNYCLNENQVHTIRITQ